MQWTITEEHRQEMAAFFADFWQMIKASYEIPQEPKANSLYWRTLVQWCDELMNKHGSDPTANRLVVAYLDAQADRDTAQREQLQQGKGPKILATPATDETTGPQ